MESEEIRWDHRFGSAPLIDAVIQLVTTLAPDAAWVGAGMWIVRAAARELGRRPTVVRINGGE